MPTKAQFPLYASLLLSLLSAAGLFSYCQRPPSGWFLPCCWFVFGPVWTWLNHPYYFSYYNPLLGGGPSAVKTVQIGSGEVLDMAMAYLNHKPNPQEQVIVCGTNLPRCEYTAAGQMILNREALLPVHRTGLAPTMWLLTSFNYRVATILWGL